ncbi:MAG TPA: NAD(P)-binding protein [Dehalococcoidia bacterium]|nr:NAD(P)-binding protein [Dehalococcoidia bacterium]
MEKRKYDALIVGGGPGGLTIASLLAKEGVSSAIIESEPSLGGRYRSVVFHGCRSDNGVRMPTAMVRKPEDTYMYRFLAHMGIAPEGTREIDWTMGMIRKDSPDRIEYFSMDPSKGVDNFFDFFAFGSGLPMEEPSRKDLRRAFRIMEDMSEEECRKYVNISFADWIDKNVQDPIANTVLQMASPLMGAAAADVNYGGFANVFGTFPRVGALLFWYPTKGTMQDMVIDPLTRYYMDQGGTILTNRRARSILIEDGEVKGVIVHNNETRFLEEYRSPVVISALPIFQAMARNILRREFLTEDWAEAIELCGRLTYEDLSVFYLLSEEILPKDGYGWVHIFDPDYGLPTYVGDWCLGYPTFNVHEPPGKQYLYAYIPGGLPDTHFGLISPPEVVNEAVRRWENAVTKVFPDFPKAIEHKGMSLQLNWGRYAWAKVPTEIDLQSPNIRGLFFAGDSIRSVTSMVSDKIYQMVFPLYEMVSKYMRS